MKLTLNTIKEIVVLSIHKTTVENITKSEAISDCPVLYWCNGVLFNISQSQSDQVFIKQTEGTEYLDTVTFAISDKITESKWNGYTIEVRDVTNHSLYEPLTKSLKESP